MKIDAVNSVAQVVEVKASDVLTKAQIGDIVSAVVKKVGLKNIVAIIRVLKRSISIMQILIAVQRCRNIDMVFLEILENVAINQRQISANHKLEMFLLEYVKPLGVFKDIFDHFKIK